MRMLFASLIAALAALVLGSVALANTSGLDDHASTVAEEKAADAALLGSANAVGGAETSAAAKTKADEVRAEAAEDAQNSRTAGIKAEDTVETETDDDTDDAERRVEGANADAFGQVRSAEVQAAHEAGDTPESAWENEEHPTGGPEAATTPQQAQGGGDAAESHRADGDHRQNKDD